MYVVVVIVGAGGVVGGGGGDGVCVRHHPSTCGSLTESFARLRLSQPYIVSGETRTVRLFRHPIVSHNRPQSLCSCLKTQSHQYRVSAAPAGIIMTQHTAVPLRLRAKGQES